MHSRLTNLRTNVVLYFHWQHKHKQKKYRNSNFEMRGISFFFIFRTCFELNLNDEVSGCTKLANEKCIEKCALEFFSLSLFLLSTLLMSSIINSTHFEYIQIHLRKRTHYRWRNRKSFRFFFILAFVLSFITEKGLFGWNICVGGFVAFVLN